MRMRLWHVFLKSVREQKRDLWVLGLSLAFAPLFVLIYWLMTGGTGTTSYGVLVLNQDVAVTQAEDGRLAAGDELVDRLHALSYQNGSPLLRVTPVEDRQAAEAMLRDRAAAALVVIPADFSAQLAAFQAGDVSAQTNLTFVGDLTNPTYTLAAVMAMTAADAFTQSIANAPRPVRLMEIPLGASAARTEFENYVPGLLILAVVLLIFQAAMTPARDLESGVLRRMRLTPLNAFEYLGGTSLWLGLVSLASLLLTFATAVALGFRSQGPLWLAVVVAAVTSLSIIGIGLLVAGVSRTVSQAFVIANFPLALLMFLTGAAFPLPRLTLFELLGRSFALADLLPPTHAVVALNKIFTLGAGPRDVIFELSALTLLSALYFGLGIWWFQRTQMGAGRRRN